MNTSLLSNTSDVVDDALALVGGVRRTEAGAWDVPMESDWLPALRIGCDDRWLRLDAAVVRDGQALRPSAEECGGWLRRHAALAGPLKFVLDPCDQTLHVAAELIVDGEDDAESEARIHQQARLLCTVQAFREAGSRSWPEDEEPAAGTQVGGNLCVQSTEMARHACSEAGWPVRGGEDGRLAIPLEVAEAVFEAAVQQGDADSDFVLLVEVSRANEGPDVCRHAAALLLLLTARHARLVRAAADASGETVRYLLEASVPRTARPREWASALSALSIAVDGCWQELEVLRDEAIARAYLQNQGWQE